MSNNIQTILYTIERQPDLQKDIHMTKLLENKNLGLIVWRKVENILLSVKEHNFPLLSEAILNVINWNKKIKKWKQFPNKQCKEKYISDKKIIDDIALCINTNKNIITKSAFDAIVAEGWSEGTYRGSKTKIYDIVYTFYELLLSNGYFHYDHLRLRTLSHKQGFQLTPFMQERLAEYKAKKQ